MKKIILFFAIAAGLILQVTIFSRFKIFGVKPDLILVIVLAIGFFQGSYRGISYGFLGGLLEDIFSSVNLGTNALSKVLCGFLVSLIGRKVYESLGAQAAIIVIFSLLDRIFTWVILLFSATPQPFSLAILVKIAFYISYNLIVGLVVFPLMKKISKKNERANHS